MFRRQSLWAAAGISICVLQPSRPITSLCRLNVEMGEDVVHDVLDGSDADLDKLLAGVGWPPVEVRIAGHGGVMVPIVTGPSLRQDSFPKQIFIGLPQRESR